MKENDEKKKDGEQNILVPRAGLDEAVVGEIIQGQAHGAHLGCYFESALRTPLPGADDDHGSHDHRVWLHPGADQVLVGTPRITKVAAVDVRLDQAGVHRLRADKSV